MRRIQWDVWFQRKNGGIKMQKSKKFNLENMPKKNVGLFAVFAIVFLSITSAFAATCSQNAVNSSTTMINSKPKNCKYSTIGYGVQSGGMGAALGVYSCTLCNTGTLADATYTDTTYGCGTITYKICQVSIGGGDLGGGGVIFPPIDDGDDEGGSTTSSGGISPGYAVAHKCSVGSTNPGIYVNISPLNCKTVGTAVFATTNRPTFYYCKECNSGYYLTENEVTSYSSGCGTIRYTTCSSIRYACKSLAQCTSTYCCKTGAKTSATCPLGYTLGSDGLCGKNTSDSSDDTGYYRVQYGTCSPSQSDCYVGSDVNQIYYASGSSAKCTGGI